MAHFPTLEDAATVARSNREKDEVLFMDDMLEALRQLKISEWLLGWCVSLKHDERQKLQLVLQC